MGQLLSFESVKTQRTTVREFYDEALEEGLEDIDIVKMFVYEPEKQVMLEDDYDAPIRQLGADRIMVAEEYFDDIYDQALERRSSQPLDSIIGRFDNPRKYDNRQLAKTLAVIAGPPALSIGYGLLKGEQEFIDFGLRYGALATGAGGLGIMQGNRDYARKETFAVNAVAEILSDCPDYEIDVIDFPV